MYSKIVLDATYRETVRRLINSARFKIGQHGKLEYTSMAGALNIPWVFTNHDARRKFCGLWNGIYCKEFNLIPRFCRFNCWKTVAYPNNVFETFQMADVLRSLDLPSKCGADRRNYTHRAWGAYIYGDSLEQGREYYAMVRDAVTRVIGPHVDVILKRGCTEMERLKQSDKWDNWTDDEQALEAQIDDLFSMQETDFHQSAWLKRDIKEGWILRAIEIGDPTVEKALAQYGNGVTIGDLTVRALTYHDKD